MTRRTLLALFGAALAGVPAVASAVVLQWTLVGVPLTATANQSTTFTLTATNLLMLNDLGCLEVDLPGSFVIESLGAPTASNGDAWSAFQSGNAVIVHSLSGGGRLANIGTSSHRSSRTTKSMRSRVAITCTTGTSRAWLPTRAA